MMEKGNPYALLTEELADVLFDLGAVYNTYSEVELTPQSDAAYAMVWYGFNLASFKEFVISSALTLEVAEKKTRVYNDFEQLMSLAGSPDTATLHDLRDLQNKLAEKFSTSTLAYKEVLDKNRVIEVLLKSAQKHLNLMGANLEQAIKNN